MRIVTAAFLLTALAGGAAGQTSAPPRAALPAIPYWWPLPIEGEVEVEAVPLAWYNDVDRVVIGAGARHPLGAATVWWGLGFGLDSQGSHPTALEATAVSESGSIGFRRLHGRHSAWLRSRPFSLAGGSRISAGIALLWLDDGLYVDSIPLFQCQAESPASPCLERPTPYGWSAGRDHAIEIELAPDPFEAIDLTARLIAGLKVAGGDHDYLRGEIEWRTRGMIENWSWLATLGGGWTSGDAPLQRRFHLHGSDPATRWVNPLLATRGALLADAPYVADAGARLRAYTEIRALMKRYVAGGARLGRQRELGRGFWGGLEIFVDAAWTPALPNRFGPEQLHPNGAFLFDWRELPDGQGEPQGRFRARVLEVPAIWADAGVALAGGHERVGVRLSIPFWASAPEFADASPFDGPKRALQARWALTFVVRAPDAAEPP